MATIKDIDQLIDQFSSEYRHPGFPAIRKSEIYSLHSDRSKVSDATLHWPDTWPFNGEPGVYAIRSGELVIYIGKASQRIGDRLGTYFRYSEDRRSGVPKKEHTWRQPPTSVVAWAVPKEQFFEASALEEFLIHRIGVDNLPDNTRG